VRKTGEASPAGEEISGAGFYRQLVIAGPLVGDLSKWTTSIPPGIEEQIGNELLAVSFQVDNWQGSGSYFGSSGSSDQTFVATLANAMAERFQAAIC
jgi:hypothetical protein